MVWQRQGGRSAAGERGLTDHQGPPGTGVPGPLLRPALELAWAVAHADEEPPPRALRPLMRFAKLPDRALATVRRVVEEDEAFRSRVVEVAAPSEADLGRAGWLWLARPDGWQDELATLAAEASAVIEFGEGGARGTHRSAPAGRGRGREAARRAGRRLGPGRGRPSRGRPGGGATGPAGGRSPRGRTTGRGRSASDPTRYRRGGGDTPELRRWRRRAPTPPGCEPTETARRPRWPSSRPRSPRPADGWLARRRRQPTSAPSCRTRSGTRLPRRAPSGRRWPRHRPPSAADPTRMARHWRRRPMCPPASSVVAPSAGPAARGRPTGPRYRPTPLPPAVFEESAAAAVHLVRVSGMVLLVDGYNVTLRAWAELAIPEQRRRLVDALAELVARTGVGAQVVFDGAEQPEPVAAGGTARSPVRGPVLGARCRGRRGDHRPGRPVAPESAGRGRDQRPPGPGRGAGAGRQCDHRRPTARSPRAGPLTRTARSLVGGPETVTPPRHDDAMTSLTISCDECTMQGTAACEDCVVTFLCGREPNDAIIIDAGRGAGRAPARPGRAGAPPATPAAHGLCLSQDGPVTPERDVSRRSGRGGSPGGRGGRLGRGRDRAGGAVRHHPSPPRGPSGRGPRRRDAVHLSQPGPLDRPELGPWPAPPPWSSGPGATFARRRCHRRRPAARPDGGEDPSGRIARYSWQDHYVPLRRRPRGHGRPAAGRRLAGPRPGRRQRLGRPGGRLPGRPRLVRQEHQSAAARPGLVVRARLGRHRRPPSDRAAPRRRVRRLHPVPAGVPDRGVHPPGVLDARRCLAWLVQAPGVFPPEHRVALGDRIYGCDECQEVCPVNVRAERAAPAGGRRRRATSRRPACWSCWRPPTPSCWSASGAGTSPEREPRYLRRNALLALGNVADGGDARGRRRAGSGAGRPRPGGAGPRGLGRGPAGPPGHARAAGGRQPTPTCGPSSTGPATVPPADLAKPRPR